MTLDDLARSLHEAHLQFWTKGDARPVIEHSPWESAGPLRRQEKIALARAVVLTRKDDIELGTSRSRALDAAKARTRLHALIAEARQVPS